MSSVMKTLQLTIFITTILFSLVACARHQRQKAEKNHHYNHNTDNYNNNNNNNHNRQHRNALRNKKHDANYCELEIKCREDDAAVTNLSLPIRLPVRGPKGPPGPPGPRGERGPAGASVISAVGGGGGGMSPATAASLLKRRVAFCVGLVPNLGPVTERTTVKFDKIITNFGSAYDPDTGIVTAPTRGVYHFNVIVSAQSQQKAAVAILHNGDLVATVWSESKPFWSTSNNVVILELKKGDQVWLDLLPKASYLHGYMYTSFSGFIVFDF